nr:MAG TPA: hypothetical protein [Bacteriophage sp.]
MSYYVWRKYMSVHQQALCLTVRESVYRYPIFLLLNQHLPYM